MNAEAILNSSITTMQQFFHDLENVEELAPSERRLLGLKLQQLAALPEITSDEDAAHFMRQLAGMRDRLTDPTQLEAIAMAHAVMLRVAEFILSGDAWDDQQSAYVAKIDEVVQ